jgi:hypothetical protein
MVLSDANVISILPVNVEEWRQPLIINLEHGMLPDDPKHRSEVRRRFRTMRISGACTTVLFSSYISNGRREIKGEVALLTPFGT